MNAFDATCSVGGSINANIFVEEHKDKIIYTNVVFTQFG